MGDPSVFGTELGCKGSWQGEETMDKQGDKGKSVDGSGVEETRAARHAAWGPHMISRSVHTRDGHARCERGFTPRDWTIWYAGLVSEANA